jgi:hypothetical protein
MPELGVFAGRQGLQDAPLLEQLTLDLFHPREDLEARVEAVGADVRTGGA